MPKSDPHKLCCGDCGAGRADYVAASAVSEGVGALIRRDHPDWPADGVICRPYLRRYRLDYVQQAVAEEKEELAALDRAINATLDEEEILSKNVDQEYRRRLTLADRAADKLAAFGGSWRFVGLFGLILVAWITLNSIALLKRPFDPFPYILLNLVLSCLAAIQAPIIMMSQNRWEARDRLRAEHDYNVNRKAEVEVRNLHGKLDHVITQQSRRLLEIQQIQTALMAELTAATKPRRTAARKVKR